jgi:hypothetical protein
MAGYIVEQGVWYQKKGPAVLLFGGLCVKKAAVSHFSIGVQHSLEGAMFAFLAEYLFHISGYTHLRKWSCRISGGGKSILAMCKY